MIVVVDSNVVAAYVMPLPYSQQAQQHITAWSHAGVELIAPTLFEYELATIARRYSAANRLTQTDTQALFEATQLVLVDTILPTPTLHQLALIWAERIGQSKTYDAHYLALAEQESAEFWTVDKRLANTMQQLGYDWVKSIIGT